MVASRAKYLITDMGVGHLLTLDEMWSPFPWARQAYTGWRVDDLQYQSRGQAIRGEAKKTWMLHPADRGERGSLE